MSNSIDEIRERIDAVKIDQYFDDEEALIDSEDNYYEEYLLDEEDCKLLYGRGEYEHL